MGGFLAHANPLRQLVIHQRKPDIVLRAIEQIAQPVELAEYLKHARQHMQLHTRIAGLQSLDRAESRADALGQRLLRQAAPTPTAIDVAAQFLECPLYGDRKRSLILTALNRTLIGFNSSHMTHYRSRYDERRLDAI